MSRSAQYTEEFVALLAEHRDDIFGFILSILPHRADAEDVFQRTSVVLWRKFDTFQAGTSFFSWAARVAQLEVMNYCKQRGRDRLEFWTHDLVELIADTRHQQEDYLVRQKSYLADCLKALKPRDRELIDQRYGRNTTSKALAESLGRPAITIYKSLERIRRALYECVERKIARERRG